MQSPDRQEPEIDFSKLSFSDLSEKDQAAAKLVQDLDEEFQARFAATWQAMEELVTGNPRLGYRQAVIAVFAFGNLARKYLIEHAINEPKKDTSVTVNISMNIPTGYLFRLNVRNPNKEDIDRVSVGLTNGRAGNHVLDVDIESREGNINILWTNHHKPFYYGKNAEARAIAENMGTTLTSLPRFGQLAVFSELMQTFILHEEPTTQPSIQH